MIYNHILLMSSCSLNCIDHFFPLFLANCSPLFLYALSAIKQFEVLLVLMFFFCQILSVNFLSRSLTIRMCVFVSKQRN